jgi:hypothetical protein
MELALLVAQAGRWWRCWKQWSKLKLEQRERKHRWVAVVHQAQIKMELGGNGGSGIVIVRYAI